MPKICRAALAAVLALAAKGVGVGVAQTAEPTFPGCEQLKDPKAADVTVVGSVLEPAQLAPPLDRAEGPEGTQSYAVVVEDPDVPKEPPFDHLLIWNIPAEVTELREGIPAPGAASARGA